MCFSPEGGRMIQAKPTRLKQDMLSYLKEQKALRPLISLPWPPQPPRALTLTLLTAPSVPSPFSPHNSLPRSVKEEPGSKAINHGSDFWWLIRSRGWEGATLSSLPPLPTLCSGARILPGLLQIARALSVKKCCQGLADGAQKHILGQFFLPSFFDGRAERCPLIRTICCLAQIWGGTV